MPLSNDLWSEAAAALEKLDHAIHPLSANEYSTALPLLGGSTIGEHTRHIIELFQCLTRGYDSGVVNYDQRDRNMQIQTDVAFASQTIRLLTAALNKQDKDLLLQTIYSQQTTEMIPTNYHRELLTNIEHCIHHQAIIKIGLHLLGKTNIDHEFGVAKSTIAYRKNVYS